MSDLISRKAVEIWKDIKGYDGLYQISNLGRVKSLERYRKGNGGSLTIVKETILKQSKNNKGYYRVELCRTMQARYKEAI